MKSKNLKCWLSLVAVASVAVCLSALASPDVTSCPDRIVVGQRGPYDEYAYFNRAKIDSADIPSEPGIKYTCTYEGHSGMQDRNHTLNANEFVKSLGTGWRKDGNAYTCTQGSDCAFVIQQK
jgi:hypothetical protein